MTVSEWIELAFSERLSRRKADGCRPNVPHAKLHGQGPRAYKTRGAAAAAVRVSIRADAICSRRDAAQVLFGRGASAPDRSRAVTASAWS